MEDEMEVLQLVFEPAPGEENVPLLECQRISVTGPGEALLSIIFAGVHAHGGGVLNLRNGRTGEVVMGGGDEDIQL